MFSSQRRLAKRTPENGIDRESYIRLLADEYQSTTDLEAQIQVTANLANFAYDPINYGHFVQNAIPKLFVDLLGCRDVHLVLNGITGICNCCLDDRIRQQLLECHAIESITQLIDHVDAQVVLNAITALMFLHSTTPESNNNNCQLICTHANIRSVKACLTRNSKAADGKSSTDNRTLQTVAKLFLTDFAHEGASNHPQAS